MILIPTFNLNNQMILAYQPLDMLKYKGHLVWLKALEMCQLFPLLHLETIESHKSLAFLSFSFCRYLTPANVANIYPDVFFESYAHAVV